MVMKQCKMALSHRRLAQLCLRQVTAWVMLSVIAFKALTDLMVSLRAIVEPVLWAMCTVRPRSADRRSGALVLHLEGRRAS